MDDKKPAEKKRNLLKTVLLIVLVVVLVVVIAAVILYNGILNKIERFDDTLGTMSLEELAEYLSTADDADLAPDASMITEPETFDVMTDDEEPIGGEIINIMLVGQDTRKAERRGLSDTMILVSINRESKKLVMTSFLRDLYIDIVGLTSGKTYRNRLNTAYCTGGIQQLGDTLALNFGVEIDNYVEVDFTAFQEIVDALGGVDIELTKNEAGYLNTRNEYLQYDWELVEGMNHLDGTQTLAYSRIRKIDSDFHRTERQRKVMTLLFEKVKDMDLTEIMGLAEQFLPMVTTDMSNSDITKYIVQLVPILSELEVETLRIPIDGTWYGLDVGTEGAPKYVICCRDLGANRDAMREAIGEEDSE